jgi:hypothetical protein
MLLREWINIISGAAPDEVQMLMEQLCRTVNIKTTEVYFKNKLDLARSGGPLTVNGIFCGGGDA